MIINIIPETKTTRGEGVFSYMVPKKLAEEVKIGSIVTVPFGKRKIRGVVKAKSLKLKATSLKTKLRSIYGIDEQIVIPENYLEIANWVSKYYLCSLGEAISLFLPPIINRPRNKIQDTNKTQISNYKQKLNPLTKIGRAHV